MNRMPKIPFSILILMLTLVCLTWGCTNTDKDTSQRNSDDPAEQTDPAEQEPVINDPAFHEGLIEAANEYLGFGLVDHRIHVAPEAGAPAIAPGSEAPQPTMSTSDHESTHGKKLYFLFAKEIAHYLDQDGSDSPVGQAIVMESWTSKSSNPEARNLRNHACGIRINPRVSLGGQTLEIGKRNDLFVMLKLATETPNTDQGWVYGVVTPDTKEVTSAGKVASCMNCHIDAKHDRLFGPVLSTAASPLP